MLTQRVGKIRLVGNVVKWSETRHYDNGAVETRSGKCPPDFFANCAAIHGVRWANAFKVRLRNGPERYN